MTHAEAIALLQAAEANIRAVADGIRVEARRRGLEDRDDPLWQAFCLLPTTNPAVKMLQRVEGVG